MKTKSCIEWFTEKDVFSSTIGKVTQKYRYFCISWIHYREREGNQKKGEKMKSKKGEFKVKKMNPIHIKSIVDCFFSVQFHATQKCWRSQRFAPRTSTSKFTFASTRIKYYARNDLKSTKKDKKWFPTYELRYIVVLMKLRFLHFKNMTIETVKNKNNQLYRF